MKTAMITALVFLMSIPAEAQRTRTEKKHTKPTGRC